MIASGDTPLPAARPTARQESGHQTKPAAPPADRTAASKRFGSALDKLERQGGERGGEAKEVVKGEATRPAVLVRKGATEERGDGGAAATPTTLHATTRAAEVATSPVDTPARAEIERMAAAIAEPARDARQASATVTLPAGGVAEGAEVSRDATGALSVRLTGLDPRLGALATDALRRDLATALRARKLTVREIELRPRADGRPPAPPPTR